MDHGYFKDRISGFLDGELRDYEMEAMRQHLEECAECREIYEDLRKLDAIVEGHSGLDGDDYWEAQAQKIEARLATEAEPEVTDIARKRGWGLGWKLAAVAASVGVLTFIGLHQTEILQQDGEPKKVSTMPAPTTADTNQVQRAAPEGAVSESKELDAPQERLGVQESEGIEAEQEVDQPEPERQRIAPPQASPEPSASRDVESREKSATEEALSDFSGIQKEEIARKPLADIQSSADESVERFQAAQREDSRMAGMPMQLSWTNYRSGSPSSVAAASALGPTAKIVTGTLTTPETSEEMTLADWVARRDSLEMVWTDLNDSRENLRLSFRQERPGFSDVHLVERQLIEAQFNVGRLARGEDQAALDEAREFLRRYIERPDARYRSTARMYLDQLQPAGSDD